MPDQRVILRQQARRREVMEAAIAVFSERGHRAASMNDMPPRSGWARPRYRWYQPQGPLSPEQLGSQIAGLLLAGLRSP